MAGQKKSADQICVSQIRSSIHCSFSQKATLSALGLRGIGRKRCHKDTPAFRGRVKKVAHLVRIEKD